MKAIFWHRRDLRFNDNAGLYKALKACATVQPVFIFDQSILDVLPRNDQRVRYIHQAIVALKNQYRSLGSDLMVYYGKPVELIPRLAQEFGVEAVYTNRDYEPNAISRDTAVFDQLKAMNISFFGAKDQVIFEKNEVVKDNGEPYTVFTPYSRKWKAKLNAFFLKPYPNGKYAEYLAKHSDPHPMIALEEMGFENAALHDFPPLQLPENIVKTYHQTRDIPSINGTTRMSVHLRFGTVSIRALAAHALMHNETYLNELIWRDFYQMILHYFPDSATKAIKPAYDRIQWEYDPALFQAWCEGKTGYPLVDAGMRELNATGHMHNRVRMVVASFLTKHLLHDWRLGERYFAEKLLDFELASNIGGWQWAAGSGCDAAPYFRIFNPTSQLEKFDKQMTYVKKWVPEVGTSAYPKPIVEHTFARNRCLDRYKMGLSEGQTV